MTNEKRNVLCAALSDIGKFLSTVGLIAALIALFRMKNNSLLVHIILCSALPLGVILNQISEIIQNSRNGLRIESHIIVRIISILILSAGLIAAHPLTDGGSEYIDMTSIQQIKPGDGVTGGSCVVSCTEGGSLYSTLYVPDSYKPVSGDDVGAILYYKSVYVNKHAYYSRSVSSFGGEKFDFKCEEITFTLVDRATGRVLGTTVIAEEPPTRVSSGGFRDVPEIRAAIELEKWIAEVWQ